MTGRLLPLHLGADSLWSRHGFSDGSPFEFEDHGQDHDDDPPHADWTLLRETMSGVQRADLLELLVRRHLVPAIAAATGETPDIIRIATHHNPVRDARFDSHGRDGAPGSWDMIEVEVSRDEILEAAGMLTRTP
jgi:hypothetical protein